SGRKRRPLTLFSASFPHPVQGAALAAAPGRQVYRHLVEPPHPFQKQAPLILLTESPNGLSSYFGSFQDPIFQVIRKDKNPHRCFAPYVSNKESFLLPPPSPLFLSNKEAFLLSIQPPS